MDESPWFDDSNFPEPGRFDSPEEWGEAIYNVIKGDFQYKIGGSPAPIQEQEFRTYGVAYAMAEMDSHAVIQPSILKAASRLGIENPGDGQVDVNATRLASRFQDEGWVRGNPEYCQHPSVSDGSDFVLVRNSLQLDSKDEIRGESVLSRTEIWNRSERALETFHAQENSGREVSKGEIDLVSATIETRLEKLDWIFLSGSNSSERIWLSPGDLFSELSITDPGSSITNREIESQIIAYLENLDMSLRGEIEFDLSPIINELTPKMKEEGWKSLRDPRVEEGELSFITRWYESDELLKEALKELDRQYRDYFENPSQEDSSEVVESRRWKIYEFYRQNKRPLSRQGFFDSTGELKGKIGVFEYRVEAAEKWKELEEAEIESGSWNPGDDNWKPDNRAKPGN